MILKVEDLCFAYKDRMVLKGINCEIEGGNFVSVLGPNGVGKSTFFKCILGLLPPSRGDVLIDGESIKNLSAGELARKMAYIPQSHNPVFNYTVMDMVLLGTTAQLGKFSVPQKKHVEMAEQALEMLNISYLRDRGYARISGGERQMTFIARAIAQQAGILVMDEPSASLDYGNRIRLMDTVRGLTEKGYTVIQSTHDPEQAYNYSDRVMAIMDGRSIACGRPEDVVTQETLSVLYGMQVHVVEIPGGRIACVPCDNI